MGREIEKRHRLPACYENENEFRRWRQPCLYFFFLFLLCLTFILGTFIIISGYITADSSHTKHANGSQLIMMSLLVVAGANVTATKRMILVMMMIPVVSTQW